MIKKDTCEIYCYDEEKVNRIQGNLQTVDISSVAQMLKAIADKNRAKITYALCQDDELCVCDIAKYYRCYGCKCLSSPANAP